MNTLLMAVSIVVMLLVMWFVLRSTEDRKLNQLLTDDDLLVRPPERAHRVVKWKSALSQTEALAAVTKALIAKGATPLRRNDLESILMVGSRAEARMKGLWAVPVTELPLVVVVQVASREHGADVTVRLDDAFGFQILIGSARTRFAKRYEAAFDRLLSAAHERLDQAA